MDELYDLPLAENGRGILLRQLSLIHGYGLFTTGDLPVETVLCRRLELRSELSARDKRAIIGSDGPISLENIDDDVEITVDYCSLLSISSWQTPCLCGFTNCRRIIKSNDYH